MSHPASSVLFILSSLCFGGAERHVVSLLNRLDTRRHRLALAYLKPDEALLGQLDVARLDRLISVRVQRRIDLRAIRLLAAAIDEQAVDVVMCTNLYSMLYGLLTRLFTRRRPRLVTVFHTTAPQSRKMRLQLLLYKQLFRFCDLLVYVCENQRRYWRQRGYRAVAETVVFNGIDVEHFRDGYSTADKARIRSELGFAADDYVVGLCAALRPEKAHRDLLYAASLARVRGRSMKVLFIGDGPERGNIETTVRALQLQDQVRITGFKSDPRPWIAICDAMALVSHSVETFSLAALESMALGKPLVISRVGGAEEQVTDGVTGFLFEAGDVDALARHLVALGNPERRVSMGRRAAEVVRQKFTVDVMVQEFAAAFDGLAPGSHDAALNSPRAGSAADAADASSSAARCRRDPSGRPAA